MKQPVLVIMYIFLLCACSAFNRSQSNAKEGLKKMSLAQTLEVNHLKSTQGLPDLSALKVNTVYRYEEKAGIRPEVRLQIHMEKPVNEGIDSLVYISLDAEDIPLSSLNGQYMIPENLWISIIHSKNIAYKLNPKQEVRIFKLSEKQKNQLIEFLNHAVRQRDVLYPAIPPGKKKW